MSRIRTARAALIAGSVVLLGLLPSPITFAALQPSLSGLASDGVGNVLEGVRILVLPNRGGQPPVLEAWTSADGRFAVRGLEPGVYRVAALKAGYMGFLGLVNTRLRSSLDVVLRPMPSPGELDHPLPTDASWTLRLPERSVLRAVDGSAPLLDTDPGRGGSPVLAAFASIPDLIQGEFEHLVALSGSPDGGSDGGVDVRGSETRLSLGVPVRDRGRVALRGSRRTLNGTRRAGGRELGRRDAAAVEVEFSYDTGLDSSLDFTTFYAEGSLDLPAADSGGDPMRQGQHTWGYDASWAKQIGDDSRLKLELDYRDISVAPSGVAPEGFDDLPLGTPSDGLSNRMVGAAGSFESAAGRKHQYRIGVRAESLDLRVPLVRPGGTDAFSKLSARTGWNVGLDAEDAWSVCRPITVVYGLAYRQAFEGADSSRLVPRAGAVWSNEGFRAGMVLSYHATVDDAPMASAAFDRTREARSLGYDVAVAAPLPFGIRVEGARVYAPSGYGLDGHEIRDDRTSGDVYLTDGNAAALRDSVLLERQFGTTHAYLRFDRGRAEGALAPLPVLEAPLQILADRTLRFTSGSVGVRVAASGTELLAEYQRVEEALATDGLAAASPVAQYMEVRVSQDLIWLSGRAASWKLLVAARTASGTVGSGNPDRNREAADFAALALLNRQVSAGVSVAF